MVGLKVHTALTKKRGIDPEVLEAFVKLANAGGTVLSLRCLAKALEIEKSTLEPLVLVAIDKITNSGGTVLSETCLQKAII